jgi:uncharacterized protein (TIGR03382 family)
MKRAWMAGAVLAGGVVGTAGASVTVIDVSGMSSWGPVGDASNSVLLYEDEPQFFPFIVGIEYSLSVRTFGGSWLSDLGVRVSNSDQTLFVEEFFPGEGFDQTGSALLGGMIFTDIHLNPDGVIRVELFDRVDTVFGGADATLLSGSTLTVSYFIPGPGVLGVGAMGGLVLARRRR